MEELNLSERVTATINLAKKKGFEYSMHITPALFEAWMPFNETFANTACAVISWWLREHHKIIVWVEPLVHEEYYLSFADLSRSVYKPQAPVHICQDRGFENAWLIGIAYALALLSDKE